MKTCFVSAPHRQEVAHRWMSIKMLPHKAAAQLQITNISSSPLILNTNACTNHLAVCGCVLCVCDWWSRGHGGRSPGRGELPPLSTLGALLLGETSLLLQLLLEE